MIAIDPGASGAIVFKTATGLCVEKMPQTRRDVLDLLVLAYGAGNSLCLIEKVGMHMKGNAASSSVKLAKSCERVGCAAEFAGLEVHEVTSKDWQKPLQPLTKGNSYEQKKARKNEIKAHMQRRFPNIKITLWNADALAIYCYGIEDFNKRRSDRQKEG